MRLFFSNLIGVLIPMVYGGFTCALLSLASRIAPKPNDSRATS